MAFKLWGGRISITGTHNTEESEFNRYVKEARAGKLPWSLHRTDFDDALREGFYKRVCLIKGWDWSKQAEKKYRQEAYDSYVDREAADEELGAIPRKGSGVYFPRLLLENASIPSIPILRLAKKPEFFTDPNRRRVVQQWLDEVVAPILETLDPDQKTVAGEDFARDNDLTVLKVAQETGPTEWRVRLRLELRGIPFDMQEMIIEYVLDRLPRFRFANFDARGNGQQVAEKMAQQYLGKIGCIKATPAIYNEWMPKYRAALEGKTFLVEDDEDTIDDHRIMVRVNGNCTVAGTKQKGSDGKFRHGDSAIASLFTYMATTEEGEPAAGETIEKTDTPTSRRSEAMGRLISRPAGVQPNGLFHGQRIVRRG